MRAAEAFPSRYLKAADLNGHAVIVEIQEAVVEPLKGLDGKAQTKVVLHFAGKQKCMPLNRTNFLAVVKATGEEDSNDWNGHKIELYPTTTQMGGDEVECIRIRPPSVEKSSSGKKAKGAKSKEAPATDEMNDEIPF